MEKRLWQNIENLREKSPLVYNITNFVVMNTTANALLAVGASPIMSHAHSEIDEMSAISQALVINIGTLDEYWVQSMLKASALFNKLQKPWVLDPVGAGATSFRNTTLQQLLENKPNIIRGNASEIMALANTNLSATKGVDSTESSTNAMDAGKFLSLKLNCVVCISGEIDYIIEGEKILAIHNGHPMMTKVTGLGCTATALIGAFSAVNDNYFEASASAIALLSIAGEIANERSNGPGTLQLHLLDILHSISENEFLERIKLV